MMNRIILLTIFLVTLSQSLYADAIVYLKSNIATKDNLTVADIAQVDGDEADAVKNVNICHTALKDGYITKNEVYQSLRSVVTGLLVVHGSAVKLITPDTSSNTDSASPELSLIVNQFIVTKGDPVTVRLIKKSIVIEMIGKALQSGKSGDEIKISLQNGKTVTGKIVNNGVECYL